MASKKCNKQDDRAADVAAMRAMGSRLAEVVMKEMQQVRGTMRTKGAILMSRELCSSVFAQCVSFKINARDYGDGTLSENAIIEHLGGIYDTCKAPDAIR
jgi:hypothetical protein